ncbi:hypothetical protein ON010_g3547 [Phytophthora cinnamomi]|nr:hypothetical protein ON010_g3547 [Phytophthora cinnamomi]
MSLELVDDSEAFEAALNYVDEYVEPAQQKVEEAALTLALDGLPTRNELALVAVESTVAKTSSASRAPPKKQTKKSKCTASKPKRPQSYNSNRARDQQRKELLYLREKVVEMEQELKVLQGTRRPKTLNEREGDDDDEVGEVATSSGVRAPDVWKEMAGHQLEQRLKSERENRRLKAVLEGQIKIGKSLAKLLEATSTTEVGDAVELIGFWVVV